MANLDTISSVKKTLVAHLKATMPTLLDVKDDFPNPSENLKMPCATVFTGTPRYESCTPYVISKGNQVGGIDLRRPVRRVVGSYEFNIQIDLWVGHKAQRGPIYEELFKAMSPRISPMGLSLPLIDYYGGFVHFHMEGFDYPDSEQSSQRGEWRVKVDVIGTANHIIETLENVIETIENNTDVESGEIEGESQEESPPII